MRFIDLSGKSFAKWTVIRRSSGHSPAKWLCICDCGKEKTINGDSLKRGTSKSCGCACYEFRVKTLEATGGLKPLVGNHPLLIDLTGMRFGRHVVEGRAPNRKNQVMWYCICDCGMKTIVNGGSLRNGISTSCGCFRVEASSARNSTHGLGSSSEYEAWQGMKKRCYNVESKSYKDYGARGITVCERWINSFVNFFEDVGPKPIGFGYSLDRICVNGNYEPENVRWATSKEQNRNKRNNRYIEAFGETRVLQEWSEVLDIPKRYIERKLDVGFTIENIVQIRGGAYGRLQPAC